MREERVDADPAKRLLDFGVKLAGYLRAYGGPRILVRGGDEPFLLAGDQSLEGGRACDLLG